MIVELTSMFRRRAQSTEIQRAITLQRKGLSSPQTCILRYIWRRAPCSTVPHSVRKKFHVLRNTFHVIDRRLFLSDFHESQRTRKSLQYNKYNKLKMKRVVRRYKVEAGSVEALVPFQGR